MVYEIKSKYLKQFIKDIQHVNRNPENTKALELLNDKSTNPEVIILPKTKLYRSRIVDDESKIGKKPGFFGYDADGSFITPWQLARDMRANYRYIPYLYCSNNPYTALIEVRPRLAAKVSIATIQVKEKMTLLDFTIQNKPKKMSDAKFNLFKDLSYLFSKPISKDDDTLDYIPTQYIAEFAKKIGYDGIIFSSSLTPEVNRKNLDIYNLVMFNHEKCHPIKSNLFQITHNYVDCNQIDDDLEQLIVKNRVEEELDNILA